jgi:endonuclease III
VYYGKVNEQIGALRTWRIYTGREVEMARPTENEIAEALLRRHGRTFAQELGIAVEKNTPSQLFRLLCASLLFSTRISANIAVEAARALADRGWTTPEKMAESTWEERAATLNNAGYARYDERTSTMLGETSRTLLDRYKGDLRNLREEANRDPNRERRLLKEFKGIGDVGVDIFFREAQVAWDELFPFADRRALEEARKLGLADDAGELARLAGNRDFPRLVAALVRVRLSGDRDDVLEEARQGE